MKRLAACLLALLTTSTASWACVVYLYDVVTRPGTFRKTDAGPGELYWVDRQSLPRGYADYGVVLRNVDTGDDVIVAPDDVVEWGEHIAFAIDDAAVDDVFVIDGSGTDLLAEVRLEVTAPTPEVVLPSWTSTSLERSAVPQWGKPNCAWFPTSYDDVTWTYRVTADASLDDGNVGIEVSVPGSIDSALLASADTWRTVPENRTDSFGLVVENHSASPPDDIEVRVVDLRTGVPGPWFSLVVDDDDIVDVPADDEGGCAQTPSTPLLSLAVLLVFMRRRRR